MIYQTPPGSVAAFDPSTANSYPQSPEQMMYQHNNYYVSGPPVSSESYQQYQQQMHEQQQRQQQEQRPYHDPEKQENYADAQVDEVKII